MVTFRNNNSRRNNHRRNVRVFKANVDRTKCNNSFNNETFQRKNAGRNNHNASKLVEKYNDQAEVHFLLEIRLSKIIFNMQIIL